MSFSVGVQATLPEAVDKLQEAFTSHNPSADDTSKEMFQVAATVVEKFVSISKDEGKYSISVSGHSKAGMPDSASRDYLSVSISAIT